MDGLLMFNQVIFKIMKGEDTGSHLGIWIDTKNAKIIHVDKNEYKIELILSEIETKEREDGEKGNQGRFGDQYLDPEKQKHNKLNKQTKAFFQRVISALNKDASFVIFGPSSMKQKLEKEIKVHTFLKDKLDGVETVDSMTDNQLAAWIRDFYAG